MMVDDQ